MLSRLSTPPRSSLSLQLLRHFSIRVLKKGTSTSSSGCLSHKERPRNNGAKANHRFLQREGSLRLVDKHLKLPVRENGRQQDHSLACCNDIAKSSVRECKKVLCSDGAVKLSVTDDNKTHYMDGDMQLSGFQTGQISYGDAKISQIESREVQSRIISGEGHQSYGLVETKAVRRGGEKSALQTRWASCKPSLPIIKCMGVPTLRTDPCEEISSSVASQIGEDLAKFITENVCNREKDEGDEMLTAVKQTYSLENYAPPSSEEISSLVASQVGDDLAKLITENVCNREKDEGDEMQMAVKQTYSEEEDEEQSAATMHTHLIKKPAPSLARETSKQLKVRERKAMEFVKVHSVIIKRKATDKFLRDLFQKIKLVQLDSAPLTHVQTLLKKRAFLSASPEKLAAVLQVLKEFFESRDKACDTLAQNAEIIAQPLEQLHQRLLVLAEFQVDKMTCSRLGAKRGIMAMKVEKYQSALTFLKELGLSVESRNRMLRGGYPCFSLSQINMQSSLDFFVSIGITGPKLLKLLEQHPEVLGVSVNNDLKGKHKLLQQLGFTVEEFVVALRYIGQCSNEKILSQYNFLREQGLSHGDVFNMIKLRPRVISNSVVDLKAKLHFLLHTLNRDISEVSRFPSYLCYSLKDRIIPRFKVLEELSLPGSPSLQKVLSLKSTDFRIQFKIPDSVKCT